MKRSARARSVALAMAPPTSMPTHCQTRSHLPSPLPSPSRASPPGRSHPPHTRERLNPSSCPVLRCSPHMRYPRCPTSLPMHSHLLLSIQRSSATASSHTALSRPRTWRFTAPSHLHLPLCAPHHPTPTPHHRIHHHPHRRCPPRCRRHHLCS